MRLSCSSLFSSSDEVVFGTYFRDTDPPISLRRLSRSPRDIFEKKAELEKGKTIEGQNATNNLSSQDEVFETEIKLKLMYLDIIRKLKKDAKYLYAFEVDKVVKLLNKLNEEKRKADHLIAMRDYKISKLEYQRDVLHRALLDAQMIVATEIDNRQRTTQILEDVLRACRDQGPNSVVSDTITCSIFNSLFNVPGQVFELCQGYHGSQWVVDKLKTGDLAASRLVQAELNLPHNLSKLALNENCRRVILALAKIDSCLRDELVHQSIIDRTIISSMKEGQQFIEEILTC